MSIRSVLMHYHRLVTRLSLFLVVVFTCTSVVGDSLLDNSATVALGVALTNEQVQALPVHVFADGQGLPAGSGTAREGRDLYASQCAQCHGSKGQGGKAVELVGERALLSSDYPDRGIAVYWPYAPTLFEYIDRSMPPASPGSFSDEELYSVIAYLLYLNGLMQMDQTLDRQTLSAIDMPNKQGFETIAR